MDYNKCELNKAKQRAMHSLNAARRLIAAECFSMCEDGRLQHTEMHHIFYNAPSLSALALLFQQLSNIECHFPRERACLQRSSSTQ